MNCLVLERRPAVCDPDLNRPAAGLLVEHRTTIEDAARAATGGEARVYVWSDPDVWERRPLIGGGGGGSVLGEITGRRIARVRDGLVQPDRSVRYAEHERELPAFGAWLVARDIRSKRAELVGELLARGLPALVESLVDDYSWLHVLDPEVVTRCDPRDESILHFYRERLSAAGWAKSPGAIFRPESVCNLEAPSGKDTEWAIRRRAPWDLQYKPENLDEYAGLEPDERRARIKSEWVTAAYFARNYGGWDRTVAVPQSAAGRTPAQSVVFG